MGKPASPGSTKLKGLPPPLVSRMISRALAQQPLKFSDALEKVLSTLLPYSATSVANAALDSLKTDSLTRLQKVQTFPWLALLLVKWKLLQSDAPVHSGRVISADTFHSLRETLWMSDNIADRDSPGFTATAILRSLLPVQMVFQQEANAGFMRWPALIGRLPAEHPVHRQFVELMGMDSETFMDLAMSTHAAALDGRIIARAYFEPLRHAYGAKVDAFLALVSRSLMGLRDVLRADKTQEVRGRSELKEVPYFRQYPLLQVDADRFAAWHPDVLARGLEEVTHLRLAAAFKEVYAEKFGPVFEAYVLEQLIDAGIAFMRDSEIRRRAVVQTKLPEALLETDGCNVFIEAKMGLFADPLLARDDAAYVYDRTKNIRNGIEQGWTASELVRSRPDAFGSHALAEQDFLLIVTSRETWLSGGRLMQSLYPAGRFDFPTGDLGERLRRHMPLQNVFIVSIDDFESVIGHVRASGRTLGAILRAASVANADKKTSAYTLGMHLAGHAGRRLPNLLSEALETRQSRISKALDAAQPQTSTPSSASAERRDDAG